MQRDKPRSNPNDHRSSSVSIRGSKWNGSRRGFIRSLCATLPVFSIDQLFAGLPFGVQFVNVAREAGLRSKTIFGSELKNKLISVWGRTMSRR